MNAPTVSMVGLDHRRTPAEVLGAAQAAARAASLPPGTVGLVTCHRVELFVESEPSEALRIFAGWAGADVRCARVEVGEAAARHLMRVAAGLESAVLGEDQVLAQVRSAYRCACATGRPGPLLHRLFHAAFRSGRRVRSETDLAAGVRSLAGAAVAFLEQRMSALRGARVLVLGAGEMATLAVGRLRERGATVVVANRTRSNAQSLAGRFCAVSVPWEWRAAALGEADAVICATGAAEPVLETVWLERLAATGRRLVVIDLAMPRNVDAGAAAHADLVDVEALGRRLEADAVRRREAVRKAEALVEQELAEWLRWRAGRGQRVEGEGTRRAVLAGVG